jgi:hypothetical protein
LAEKPFFNIKDDVPLKVKNSVLYASSEYIPYRQGLYPHRDPYHSEGSEFILRGHESGSGSYPYPKLKLGTYFNKTESKKFLGY